MYSAALGSNYDNYMIYIGWFTTCFIIVAAPPTWVQHNCFNALGLDAVLPGDFTNRGSFNGQSHQHVAPRWIQFNGNNCCQPLPLPTVCRFSATGTPTTRTRPPARRGSWPRAPGSPPLRSQTGSRTGGSETGRQRDPGKRFLFLLLFYEIRETYCLCNFGIVMIRDFDSQ